MEKVVGKHAGHFVIQQSDKSDLVSNIAMLTSAWRLTFCVTRMSYFTGSRELAFLAEPVCNKK